MEFEEVGWGSNDVLKTRKNSDRFEPSPLVLTIFLNVVLFFTEWTWSQKDFSTRVKESVVKNGEVAWDRDL